MENKITALEFLKSRLDDVAPERYPSHSVRIIMAAAMEEYLKLKTDQLNERIKNLREALDEIASPVVINSRWTVAKEALRKDDLLNTGH